MDRNDSCLHEGAVKVRNAAVYLQEREEVESHLLHLSAVFQLSSWTRFWISLSGSTLTFYGAKALRASERKHVSEA